MAASIVSEICTSLSLSLSFIAPLALKPLSIPLLLHRHNLSHVFSVIPILGWQSSFIEAVASPGRRRKSTKSFPRFSDNPILGSWLLATLHSDFEAALKFGAGRLFVSVSQSLTAELCNKLYYLWTIISAQNRRPDLEGVFPHRRR